MTLQGLTTKLDVKAIGRIRKTAPAQTGRNQQDFWKAVLVGVCLLTVLWSGCSHVSTKWKVELSLLQLAASKCQPQTILGSTLRRAVFNFASFCAVLVFCWSYFSYLHALRREAWCFSTEAARGNGRDGWMAAFALAFWGDGSCQDLRSSFAWRHLPNLDMEILELCEGDAAKELSFSAARKLCSKTYTVYVFRFLYVFLFSHFSMIFCLFFSVSCSN